jgi:hypothetical protein
VDEENHMVEKKEVPLIEMLPDFDNQLTPEVALS